MRQLCFMQNDGRGRGFSTLTCCISFVTTNTSPCSFSYAHAPKLVSTPRVLLIECKGQIPTTGKTPLLIGGVLCQVPFVSHFYAVDQTILRLGVQLVVTVVLLLLFGPPIDVVDFPWVDCQVRLHPTVDGWQIMSKVRQSDLVPMLSCSPMG